MDYIETPRKTVKQLPKPTVEKEKTDVNKEQFDKARAAHRAEISRIKAERKKLTQDIKRHRLLIKQAGIVYKLSQMKEKTNGK